MPDLQKKLSRRAFIFGGSAALLSAGITLSLSSCAGNDSKKSNEFTKILATCAYDFSSLHPVANSNITARAALNHVCEGLYNIDYTTYKTYSGLAAQKPIKIDDLSYDVILRDEAYFSNDNKVTVQDVVAAFKSNIANKEFSPFLDFIKDISIKDSKTINFSLNYQIDNLLEQRLALVLIYPMDQTDEELMINPIGTGPWKIENVDFDEGKIEFAVNKNYQGKFSYKKLPMEWKTITDSANRASSLLNGSSNVIESSPDMYSSYLAPCSTIEYLQSILAPYLLFNCKNKPFDNYKVRQAVLYAINVGSIIEKYFNGHGIQASSFLPKTHNNYNQASQIYNYNLDTAKKILKEQNINELQVNFLVENNWVKDFANAIVGYLENVGIKLNTVIGDLNTDTYDIALIARDPSILYNDVDLLLDFWFSDNKWMNNHSNWKFSDPNKWNELNQLLTKARQSSNSNIKQYTWNQCFDIIATYCPIYPLFHRELGTAYDGDKLNEFSAKSSSGLDFLGFRFNS